MSHHVGSNSHSINILSLSLSCKLHTYSSRSHGTLQTLIKLPYIPIGRIRLPVPYYASIYSPVLAIRIQPVAAGLGSGLSRGCGKPGSGQMWSQAHSHTICTK